jgi:hypothetical protein
MADDLSNAIREGAAGPQQASGEGVSIQQHSLKDLIEADKHLQAKNARKNPVASLTFAKIVPPGGA